MKTPNTKCSHPDIISYGFRKTKRRGSIQRYKCTVCGRTFARKDGFWHKHYAPETILSVLSQYWKGLTTRELADEHEVMQKTVLAWLLEYTTLLYRYLCRLAQRYTKKLHVDELFQHMHNTFYYLWDAICADTRFAFWILSDKRDYGSAKRLLEACPVAELVVSDGAFSYPRVVRERYHGQAMHHQCVSFGDKKHNNMAERMQNMLRRFLHPRRGFCSLRTGTMQMHGFWCYYNFIRQHSAIGMTPAQKAGIIKYYGCKTTKQRLLCVIQKAAVSFWLILYQP